VSAAVRLAAPDDRDAVVATTASAFAGDPAWDFILGPGNRAGAEAFAGALFDARVVRGTVWVTDHAASVAMWDRVAPERSTEAAVDPWPAFRDEVGEQVWQRLWVYDSAVKGSGPDRPYWYLGVLATHPDRQGEGLAGAVLEPGFAAAADDGWDCWLETSKPTNKPFYAGRGFTEEVAVAGLECPPTWWLRRPAERS
jgi:GNAT superfamily N-acetyltransferase